MLDLRPEKLVQVRVQYHEPGGTKTARVGAGIKFLTAVGTKTNTLDNRTYSIAICHAQIWESTTPFNKHIDGRGAQAERFVARASSTQLFVSPRDYNAHSTHTSGLSLSIAFSNLLSK